MMVCDIWTRGAAECAGGEAGIYTDWFDFPRRVPI